VARIRTIKPEYWTDERVGECSVSARLLFVATWNFADDHGGLDRSSKQLKAQAFPYDNIDCEPLVQELLKAGLLIEYEVGGKKYLHIKGFRTHQKVEKPARPRIPVYDNSPSPPRVLPESSPESSGSSLGRESKGKEWKGENARAQAMPGVKDCGTGLLTLAAESLDCWRRDVPECNPEAFARWIVHCETSGKMLGAAQRLGQAKMLAGNGEFSAQAEVVDFCVAQGWKTLVPISDIRARRDGMSRNGPKPAKERWHPPDWKPAETG